MARASLRQRILRFLLLAAAGIVLLTLLLVLPLALAATAHDQLHAAELGRSGESVGTGTL